MTDAAPDIRLARKEHDMSTMSLHNFAAVRKQSSAPSVPASPAAPAPSARSTDEQIRNRAYEIYVKRNGKGATGDATSDWLQAERELNGAAPDPTASRQAEARSQTRGEKSLASGK
jgi:hypothetical protein